MKTDHAFLFYSIDQIKRFQDDPKKMNLTPAQHRRMGSRLEWQMMNVATNGESKV